MSIRHAWPRRGILVGAMLVSAAISAAQAAEPEVLKQVPGDAYAVMVVGNVRTFGNKLANTATRLNITLPSPDLVGYATRSMGISAGFDANSSAALVLLKPPAAREGDKYFESMPPAVLILPSTNPTLMLEKFSPTEPDKDGVSQVALPDNPDEKGFVAVVDKKWVVFGTRKEDVAAYQARGDSFAKAASPDTLKVFDANDLVIWGNIEKLGAGADKWLDDQRTDLVGMLDLRQSVNKLDPLQTTMQKYGMNGVFDSASQFFKDAGAGMITTRLTDSGATFGLVAEFRPDTPTGKFVASQAGHAPASLMGLPAGKFIAAGALQWNGETVASVMGGFLDGILADPLLAKDEHLPEMRKGFAAARQLMGLMNGTSFIFLEPVAGGKEGFLNGAMLIDASDPKKFLDLEVQNAGSLFAQQTMSSDIKTTVTTTPNALTVKGVSLTKLNVTMTARPETPDNPIKPEEKVALEMVQRVYGPNGITMYLAVVGKRVLAIYGTDMSTIEAAVAAAQENSAALANSAEIAGTTGQLAANPLAVAYLPVARWVTLAQSIMSPPAAGAAEAPLPPAILNAPPAVLSAGITGRMWTAEIHIPIATITGTQEAFTRLQKALNSGDGGGANLP
jgi:hypothetical protein